MWFCYWQPAMGSSVFIHKMWVAYLTKLVFTRVRKVMKATLYYPSKWGFWYCKTSSYVNPFYFVHLFFQVNHSVNKSYGKASYHFRLLLHILCKRCFPIKRNGAPKECGSNTELKMNSVPPVVIGLFFLETYDSEYQLSCKLYTAKFTCMRSQVLDIGWDETEIHLLQVIKVLFEKSKLEICSGDSFVTTAGTWIIAERRVPAEANYRNWRNFEFTTTNCRHDQWPYKWCNSPYNEYSYDEIQCCYATTMDV